MIEAFEGRIGGGKTLTAIQRCMQTWARGGRVATNINLKWDECKAYAARRFFVELQDVQFKFLLDTEVTRFWELVPGGTREEPVLVIIDEADCWFPNRSYGKAIGSDFWAFMKQSRKLKFDVIFITQSVKNLEGQIGRLVQYIWRFRDMEKWGIHALRLRWPFPQILQVCVDYAGDLQHKKLWTKDKELFRCYDTDALYTHFALVSEKPENIVLKRLKPERRDVPGIHLLLVFIVLLVIVMW